jgi:hypothetical protein
LINDPGPVREMPNFSSPHFTGVDVIQRIIARLLGEWDTELWLAETGIDIVLDDAEIFAELDDDEVYLSDEPKTPLVLPMLYRSPRPPARRAVGRKNHYGSRSERGTRVAAPFYSLIESAKLCGVEPRGYLREATLRAVPNPSAVALARGRKSREPSEKLSDWPSAADSARICEDLPGIGRMPREVNQDEEGLRTMQVLGQNMAWLL